jgi:asparagine synthase (glutamine-hydrolysing)
MSTVLSEHFSGTVRPGELERERAAVDPPLRTAEELAFYRIFTEALPGVRGSAAVARFVEA